MRYRELQYNQKININKNDWKRILQDSEITSEKNQELLIRIYNKEGNMATTKELADEEGLTGSPYNGQVVAWAKKILKELNIEAPKDENNMSGECYWHVPFLGAKERKTNYFLWIIRDELLSAIEELFDDNIWINNI